MNLTTYTQGRVQIDCLAVDLDTFFNMVVTTTSNIKRRLAGPSSIEFELQCDSYLSDIGDQLSDLGDN